MIQYGSGSGRRSCFSLETTGSPIAGIVGTRTIVFGIASTPCGFPHVAAQESANPRASGCGGAKLDRPAPAGRMYVGSYHAACRRAAAAIGGRLLILSARYGLIAPDTWIEPYELRMGQPGAVTMPMLRAQARRLGIDTAGTVTVLAGRDYADPVSAVWPHAARPLDNARGIGPQLARLAELARGATTQVAPEAGADRSAA
ncbi:hypothetical protein Aca07nite_28010 [Actinoplanes capillaceus]|uniref:DUF6884 domain-containing protein n=1 Tax=Actinoplanes campanulatus TaxID=113559 RepID=A0ABQ3WH09_9ACTN|nr:DUF6884 domain-containing protein [Actinoplanes capillaceus]GID45526.1 hypothetical protein Aca07nite_28010 [Actinoplanes capillaceus]